jgi:hypothetical protein
MLYTYPKNGTDLGGLRASPRSRFTRGARAGATGCAFTYPWRVLTLFRSC